MESMGFEMEPDVFGPIKNGEPERDTILRGRVEDPTLEKSWDLTYLIR